MYIQDEFIHLSLIGMRKALRIGEKIPTKEKIVRRVIGGIIISYLVYQIGEAALEEVEFIRK